MVEASIGENRRGFSYGFSLSSARGVSERSGCQWTVISRTRMSRAIGDGFSEGMVGHGRGGNNKGADLDTIHLVGQIDRVDHKERRRKSLSITCGDADIRCPSRARTAKSISSPPVFF